MQVCRRSRSGLSGSITSNPIGAAAATTALLIYPKSTRAQAIARIIHPPLSPGHLTLKKRMDVSDPSPHKPFSPVGRTDMLHIELFITCPRLCRATSGRTSILVGDLDNGSHEFKSTDELELKAIDPGPDLGDSITPWHKPLARETNLESEL